MTRLVSGAIAVLCTGALAWAGSIEGDQFVVKPYLDSLTFKKMRGGVAQVALSFQVENPSPVPVVIRDMKLEWSVCKSGTATCQKGTINLNEHGAPPFTEYKVWPHGSLIEPVSDVTTPPVKLQLSKGKYGYSITLIDPVDSSRVVLASNLGFEVR